MRYYGRVTLAAIVWGALTFGAVYPWTYWPLVTLCAVLGVMGLRAGDSLRAEESHTGWLFWLALPLAFIAIVAAVQLMPLPRDLLLAIGPSTDEFLRQYILGYATAPPPGHPLSVAPANTARGLALLIGFSLFLLGAIRALPQVSVENFVRRLAMFAAGLALFAVVQKGASGPDGTQFVYGFWQPNAPGNIFGPFINRNHFAGWMLMAAPLAFGYALGLLDRNRPTTSGWSAWSRYALSPEGSRFSLAMLAVLATGASIAISGSRSGMVSFVAAVAVGVVAVWRAFFTGARNAILLTLGAALVVGAVFYWAGFNDAVSRFSTASEDAGGRLGAWRDTVRIIRDFPVFGVGLNGYGTAMLVYQTGDRRMFYKEAHNDYLQIAAEGGLLFVVPALLAIGIVAVQIRKRFRERRDPPMTAWIRVGAVSALVGIATQSLIEFSLQMPGNTVLFLVVIALAVHRPIRSVRALASQRRVA